VRAALALVCLAAGCAGEKAEGRPWIHKLYLDGVKNVNAGDLRSRLAMQGRSLWPFSPKTYLNPFDLEIDARRVENYYHQHGFFDVRVVDKKETPSEPGAVDVSLRIDEGPPTVVRAVTLQGLDPATLAHVKKMQIAPGQRFDYQRYLDEKERIAGTLKQHGYAWAEVDGEVRVDRDARSAVVVLRVRPGPWARFGRLEVHGAKILSARQLERYARFPAGQPFSLDALDELRGRLYGLGTFSSVRVDYVQNSGHADVIATVQESTLNELRAGAGLGVEALRNDIHASIQYTRRNFLGGLRLLRLRLITAYVAIPAVWNIQRQGPAGTTDATLTQPDLFWRSELRFSVGFDLGIDYGYQNYGPRTGIAIGRDFWRRHLHAELGYDFQYLKFFDTDPAILNRPDLAGKLYGFVDPYRLAWVHQDFLADLRDRPLDPSRGGYFSFSVEEGGAWTGSAFQYEKLQPDLRLYAPLGTKRVVLAGRVLFGQIYVQGDLGSPITRRFYLGGPGSHRGFNYDRLSPQVPSGLPGVGPIPIGGDQMLLFQMELRLELFRISGYWLALAAFADGGDVAAPSCGSPDCRQVTGNLRSSVDINNLNWAAGGGLRYKTLIGTLRFDLGVRLNRLAPFEANGVPNPDPGQRFAFHISVGEPF
jgi:translocation and assembly module TamA